MAVFCLFLVIMVPLEFFFFWKFISSAVSNFLNCHSIVWHGFKENIGKNFCFFKLFKFRKDSLVCLYLILMDHLSLVKNQRIRLLVFDLLLLYSVWKPCSKFSFCVLCLVSHSVYSFPLLTYLPIYSVYYIFYNPLVLCLKPSFYADLFDIFDLL